MKADEIEKLDDDQLVAVESPQRKHGRANKAYIIGFGYKESFGRIKYSPEHASRRKVAVAVKFGMGWRPRLVPVQNIRMKWDEYQEKRQKERQKKKEKRKKRKEFREKCKKENQEWAGLLDEMGFDGFEVGDKKHIHGFTFGEGRRLKVTRKNFRRLMELAEEGFEA